MPDWTPAKIGADFDLPPTLAALQPFKEELLVLSGLAQQKACANGDGDGDHARAMAAFLTGAQPRKTGGSDIRVGVSVDQVAAGVLGSTTRFASLELGCEPGLQSGQCDSGYSCAYQANISWKTESTPMAKEVNPRLVFERLFAADHGADVARAQRRKYHQSVLDFVRDDARRLQRLLGQADRRKMEEYLSSVRDVERRVAQTELTVKKPPSGSTKPAGIPDDFSEHICLMCDMIVLAFQADLTRVVTFVLADEGSNRPYPFIDVPEGHHNLSHHGRDELKQSKIAKIDRFHVAQLAYLLKQLASVREGEQSILDNAVVAYGSCIGDGDRHNHDNLPMLLAGRAGGTLRTGRHLQYPNNTPLNNLWLSVLDRLGVSVDKLGDSSGRLPQLDG
jgi:hypothetical protein